MLHFNLWSLVMLGTVADLLSSFAKLRSWLSTVSLVLWAAFSKVCTKPGIYILQGTNIHKRVLWSNQLGKHRTKYTWTVLFIAGLFRDLTKESFFFLGLSLRSFGRWNTLWEMPGLEETAPLALESLASYLTSLNVNFSNLNLWVLLALVVVWKINERYMRTFSLKLGTSHSSIW